MLKNSALAIALLCCFLSTTRAQQLYEPRNIKAAYEAQTRSRTGDPGENYWQNHAHYTMSITVKPPQRLVKGHEVIRYTNNSPDTLSRFNFKLFMNHHKPGAPRNRPVPEDYLTSGLHIDYYAENGETQTWPSSKMDGTDKFIKLQSPLLPGEQVQLTIDWHYDLSKVSSREGAISQHSFFLAYFFPRVAVYDDYVGWDKMPHVLSQEFYNDFSDFEVSVSVPQDYLVWATGRLQNPQSVLQNKFYQRYKKSLISDEVVTIVDATDLQKGGITANDSLVTWRWKASNVTDFALAVSDEYLWDAGSVDVGRAERVSVQAAYEPAATDFQNMVGYAKHALQWFSNHTPGIAYPYPTMTVVRGFADMEYPMLANDSSHPDNPNFTRFVAEHELAHSYFPFYMGTNQTRFGFMDEGWATALEYLISIVDLGKEQAVENFKKFRVNRWINDPSFEQAIPIITPSNILRGAALSNNQYGKAALGYLALRDLLGKDQFLMALQTYMQRWHGKHPMPWDFFYSINDATQKDLNWFWKSWFFSHNYIDYSIEKVKVKRHKVKLTIRNRGGLPAPVNIILTDGKGQTKRVHLTPSIWKSNPVEKTIQIKNVNPPQSITLEGSIFMDATPSDNSWKND